MRSSPSSFALPQRMLPNSAILAKDHNSGNSLEWHVVFSSSNHLAQGSSHFNEHKKHLVGLVLDKMQILTQ